MTLSRTHLKVTLLVGIGVALGLLGLGAFAGDRLTRDCSFSRETWVAGRDPVDFQVLEHDLGVAIGCGTLEGASASRVERLLGRADQASASMWSYDVGVPELRSDYPDLELRFGRDGIVEDARVPGYIEPGLLASFGAS